MKEQRLTKWLQAGYPHFKENSGVPAWLLPERSFDKVAGRLGDSGILKIAHTLDLAPGLGKQQEEMPKPQDMPDDAWREACLRWPPLPYVGQVVNACLEASDKILRRLSQGQIELNPFTVCRGMAVLALIPFVPHGRSLLDELAVVLAGDTASPARLITKYADAVVIGDKDTVVGVDTCIEGYRGWAAWFTVFEKHALGFPSSPRLIAVTPPLSDGLADVLADMMKEAPNDGA